MDDLGLRFTRQDEKHAVPNLADIYGEYVGSDEVELWGDGCGVYVGYISDTGAGDCCTDYDYCDVEEEGERGEDLETDEGKVVLHSGMRSV
jgi:hypothetical protein